MMGFDGPIHAVVIGARGGIGSAFVDALAADAGDHKVWATSTTGDCATGCADHESVLDITCEESLGAFAEALKTEGFTPNLVINCSGLLHTADFGPERSWRHLDIEVMRRVFDVNTFGVGLLGKHLLPLFSRTGRSVFASLSARVGSISDNRLGGWYSYRASKAAQNMIIKGLSIEAGMRWRELICVALHPGTVDTELSKPFSGSVPPHKLFSQPTACRHLCRVIEQLTPEDSGQFFAWDGQRIQY
jgi:NAD(P)-dependent dehydrogenase (short-subunit alcohol dehydrogenase family)